MSSKNFCILYIVIALPNIITMFFDIYDRVKNKRSVRISFLLVLSCFLGSLVAVFAFMSNWFWIEQPEVWFVYMMICCYLGFTVIIFNLHNTRIIYSSDSDEIFFVARFRKKKFQIYEITRIYLSNEYLDVYVGDKRFRCDNYFLIGAQEFEMFVKEYHKNIAKNT